MSVAEFEYLPYRQDDEGFLFVFENESGDALDIEDFYEDVQLRVFLAGKIDNPEWDFHLNDGLTVVDVNKLIAEFTHEDTVKMLNSSYWIELRVFFSGKQKTYLSGRISIKDAQSGMARQSSDLILIVE